MKNFSQDELRKIYDTPPQELTAQIHETIISLPYRETEEKIVKKKQSHVTLIAIAMILVLMTTALAATSTTVNNWVYKVWPYLAETLMPVNLTCEDQGIEVEIVSAVVQGNELIVTYAARDLKGNRLRAGGSLFSDLDFENTSEVHTGSGEGISDYIADEQKIFGVEKYTYDTDIIPRDGYITLSFHSIDPARESLISFDPRPYLEQYGGLVRTASLPEILWDEEGSYSSDRRFPGSLKIIDWNRSLEIPLAESITLSGAGFFDNCLHVQIHNTDPAAPWIYSLDLQDNAPHLDSTENSTVTSLRWGDTDGCPEWTETFAPFSPDKLANADLKAVITRWLPSIKGNWKIEIPERMIRHSDQTEADEA